MRALFGNNRSPQRRKEEENAERVQQSNIPEPLLRAEVPYAYLGDCVGLALTHRGHKILLSTKDFGISPHIIAQGLWEPNIERAILKLIEPGFKIAEIGCNVGYHTLAMANAVGSSGHIYGFEANPKLFTLLRWSVDLNGFLPRTTLYNLAATNHTGDVRFDYEPVSPGGGHIVTKGATESPNAFTVGCRPLDKCLEHIESIDLLRMDAEGSEPIIVKGAAQLIARSPSIRIVTEWSPFMMRDHGNIAEYVALLGSHGFSAWQIDSNADFIPTPLGQLEHLDHCELVFSRDDVRPPAPAPLDRPPQ